MSVKEKPFSALITGASSGIGYETAKLLIDKGISVIGIGRDFNKSPDINNSLFHPYIFDLSNTSKIPEMIKEIKSKYQVKYLINNAGSGYFGLHEELNYYKIHEMVAVNIEAPLILTQLLLRDLKQSKGYVINISSVTGKKSSPHGCAYGATKAALSSFSASLFDEARKYGVKTVCIHPDMTQSNFYRNANFQTGANPDSYLLSTEIAQIISEILSAREGLIVSELTVQPQKHQLNNKL